MNELEQIFQEEATEIIADLEEKTLELEEDPTNSEIINSLFRDYHTIKGSAGVAGLETISRLAHKLEDLLSNVRDNKIQVSEDLIKNLLSGLDLIKQLIFGEEVDTEYVESFINGLALWLDTDSNDEFDNKKEDKPIDKILYIKIKLNREIFETGQDPLMLFKELDDLGLVLNTKTSVDFTSEFSDFDPYKNYCSWKIIYNTKESISEIEDVFIFVSDENDIEIKDITKLYANYFENFDEGLNALSLLEDKFPTVEDVVKTEHARLEELLKRKYDLTEKDIKKFIDSKSSKTNKTNFLKIGTKKLDLLMDKMGEILIAVSALHSSLVGISKDNFSAGKRQSLTKLNNLSSLVFLMQEDVMSLRMIPIESTFKRFKRMVRDLAKDFSKKIKMSFSGTDTEIDKTINDKIIDPLKHIIRNSVDHGIEKPEIRESKGKNPEGKISLSAYHREGKVIIEIEDDGKGLDKEKIRQKALERDLISPEKEYSDRDIFSLIFHPGFSTADEVSEVSGRGVGMDVVRKNVDDLNGAIDIDSKKDVGTNIKIKLPLTLSIIEGMAIKIRDKKFIIPILTIVEMLEPQNKLIKTIRGDEKVILSRGKYIPLVNLAELINFDTNMDFNTGMVLVIEGEKINFGLLVEDIIGKKDSVIKSLKHNIVNKKYISGASIMDDGSVALILDIYSIEKIVSQGEI